MDKDGLTRGEDGRSNGDAPAMIGQVSVFGLATGGVRVAMSPGLPLDIAERLLYGALKWIEREQMANRMRQAFEPPRVQIVGAPPGHGRG